MNPMASRTQKRTRRAVRKAGREAKDAVSNPILEFGERYGYVVRGFLYGAMGVIALLLALGRVSHAADQKGALHYFVNNPLGSLILGLVAVGLVPYSVWGFVRAVYDPLGRGKEPPALVARLGFLWSGLAYAALLLAVVQVLLGARDALEHDSVEGIVGRVLAEPMGRVATGVAGVVAIAAGLGQFVDAWRVGFARDLKKGAMTKEEYATAIFLGRMGMVSRGVIFTMTGWFILSAAWLDEPSRARGFGAAFDALLKEPFGHFLVFLVGLGLMALAVHSFAYARWVRTLSEKPRRK